MAAKVATPATIMIGAMDQKTVGIMRKSRRPANLLALVWGKHRRQTYCATCHETEVRHAVQQGAGLAFGMQSPRQVAINHITDDTPLFNAFPY